jgi:hypothetical protein
MPTVVYVIPAWEGLNCPEAQKSEKLPADDTNAAAMLVGKIATGEVEDLTTDDGKNAAAVALGRMGGNVRAANMSARKRKEIARKAAKNQWKA